MAGNYGTMEEQKVEGRQAGKFGLRAAAATVAVIAACLVLVLVAQEGGLAAQKRSSELLQLSWDYVDDSMDPDYQIEPVDDPDDNQYNSDFIDLGDQTGAGDISINTEEEGYSDPQMSSVEPGRVLEVARHGQLDPEHTKTRNYEFPVI